MRIFPIAVLCIGLGGCMTTDARSPEAAQPVAAKVLPPVQLSKDEVKIVEAGARSGLKDPDSARFGRMVAAQDDENVFVCLMVNAKNSYGGYSGEKPFMGLLFKAKKLFILIPDDGKFPQYRDQSVMKVCTDKGLQL